MKVISKDTVIAYQSTLAEYATIYYEFAKGMQKNNGCYKTYYKVRDQVVKLAAYLRMVESMYPGITSFKPKNYTAIYQPLSKGQGNVL